MYVDYEEKLEKYIVQHIISALSVRDSWSTTGLILSFYKRAETTINLESAIAATNKPCPEGSLIRKGTTKSSKKVKCRLNSEDADK